MHIRQVEGRYKTMAGILEAIQQLCVDFVRWMRSCFAMFCGDPEEEQKDGAVAVRVVSKKL